MKFSLVICFVAVLILATVDSSKAQSHNVTWGIRSVGDVLLQRVVVYKKSSFLWKVSDDYEFNLRNTPYIRLITQIVVTDQYKNGDGGYATLSSGGPMTTHVKIHFTSKWNHGFNFIVEIYGH